MGDITDMDIALVTTSTQPTSVVNEIQQVQLSSTPLFFIIEVDLINLWGR